MLHNLGTALSREQMKKVVGGFADEEEGGGGDDAVCTACKTDEECGIRVCRSSNSCTEDKVCAKAIIV